MSEEQPADAQPAEAQPVAEGEAKPEGQEESAKHIANMHLDFEAKAVKYE
jgi:hypothetical protein